MLDFKWYVVFFAGFVSVSVSALEQDWLINQELKEGVKEASEAEGVSDEEVQSSKENVSEQEALTSEVIYQQMTRNAEAYRDAVRQHWATPIWSDVANWVTYNDDFSVRRWVDYQNNEIKISFKVGGQPPSLTSQRVLVAGELKELLLTTFHQALQREPLFDSLREVVSRVANESWAEELVLGELYSSGGGSDELAALTRRLMSNAELRFSGDAQAGPAQLGVPLSESVTFFIPMPSNRLLRKAERLKPHIALYAKQLSVPEDLIFSVIHTESHFNPLARSKASAYGLMQVVPTSAGQDATKFLFDEAVLLTPIDLFQPDKNIQIGTAYLSLLYSHYLRDIENEASRWYCAVAAYNAGVSNVARAFVGAPQFDLALGEVNRLSSDQVLQRLLSHLPADETRRYLKKVMARRAIYDKV